MEAMEALDALGRPRSKFQTVNNQPSETVKAEAELGDINLILKKYREVGIIDNLNITEEMFADVTEFTDFQDVMQTAKVAEQEFMKLPSKVREVFNHDVATWLDTAHDQEKRSQLIEAGEVTPIEQPTPVDTPDSGPGDAPSTDPSP